MNKNAIRVLILSVVVVVSLLLSSSAIIPVAATSNLTASPGLGTPQVPGAPTNLVADPGPGYIWLWWNHPATNGDQLIKKYEIYRGVTSNGENATAHNWVYVGSSYYQGTYLGLPDALYALETAASLTPPVSWTAVVTNQALTWAA